jgi:hypothetical protein
MCSTSGPTDVEIDPNGTGFKKYKQRRGKNFKAAGKYPEFPDCRSEDLELG